MSGPNLLEANGARTEKPTRYAPLYNSRFFVGLWTNRNALRGPLGAIYTEFYRLGSTDVLIDGANVELTSRLTLARRPGCKLWSTATLNQPADSFYSFHEITGAVHVIADTPDAIYEVDTTSATQLFVKNASAGQAYFQGVGTTLYIGDGAEQVKWLEPQSLVYLWGIVAPASAPTLVVNSLANLTPQDLVGVALDGATAYVSTATEQTVGQQNNMLPWSAAILFKTSASGVQPLISFENTQTGTGATAITPIIYLDSGGHLTFSILDQAAGYGQWKTLSTVTPYNDGHWHMAVVTLAAPGGNDPVSVVLYIDGQQVAANSALLNGGRVQWNQGWWRIGNAGGISNPALPFGNVQTYFNGDLSHAALWLSASNLNPGATLTNGQVNNLWHTLITKGQASFETALLATSPTNFWELTETTGTTAADSADSNTGTYQGTVTLNQSSVLFFGSWTATTSVSLGTTLIDENGNTELCTTPGTTGATAPTWNTSINGTTADGSVVWTNQGAAALNPTSTQGYVYAYSYKSSLTGHVSTASPLSLQTGPGLAKTVTLTGQASSDPQVDTIEIYRTTDGGSTSILLFLADIPNPASGNWTYTDSTPDTGLNPLILAPINHANDPPPTGLINLTYHFGRMWGSVGTSIYASGGPDTDPGNGNEAWPPANVWVFPSPVTRLVPTSVGLLVWTLSDLYIIAGGPSITTFYSQILSKGLGLRSYNMLCEQGSLIYVYTGDRQLVSVDPSAGVNDVGFPIGDQLATNFDPTKGYLTFHIYGSMDKALYIADGSTSWYRCNPNQAPDAALSGPVWSPKASVVGGVGAIASIETSPGVYTMLIAAPDGKILARDSTFGTFTDNGSIYEAYFVMGSIVLANPGQIAEIAFFTCDFMKLGTEPTLSVLMGEISGTFEAMNGNVINDPPQIYGPSLGAASLYPMRFNFTPGALPLPAFARHLQIKVDFGTDSVQNEILSSTIFGAIHQER